MRNIKLANINRKQNKRFIVSPRLSINLSHSTCTRKLRSRLKPILRETSSEEKVAPRNSKKRERFIYKRNEVFKYSTHALTFFCDCVDIKQEKCFFSLMVLVFLREIKLKNHKFIWFYGSEGRKNVAHRKV